MRFPSSGRRAMRRSIMTASAVKDAKRARQRAIGAGMIGMGGLGGGYYLGRRSSAQAGLTSQNKGMYNY